PGGGRGCGPAGGDEPRHVGADGGIVDRRLAVGAAIVDLVAEPRQRRQQVLFQREPRVIGADRDAHRMLIIAVSTAAITRKGEVRARAGHPWIYRSDVAAAPAAPGDLVAVTGTRGRVVGHALFSDRSEITLRLVSL